MNYSLKQGAMLFALLSVMQWACIQDQVAQPHKSETMETIKEQIRNKEAIRKLYEVILNERKFDLLDELISAEYTNDQGGKGLEGFKVGITSVVKAFPDAQWAVDELIAENDKVMVKQTVKGTHRGDFQHIEPTGNTINNQGFAIYTFKEGKIIHHQIQTDRFSFLQQLDVLPADISGLVTKTDENHVFFVDHFVVPKSAYSTFLERVEYNRNYIKALPGFIRDEVMVQEDDSDYIDLMTIALWQNNNYLEEAKKSVQEEYKRINFNPVEFTQKHKIKMDRQLYSAYH